jgi:phage terminase large subunit-like protein
MVEHGQGYLSMHAPTLAFEEMVIKGEIKHDNNPAMRWMLGNVVILRDPAGNMKPDKGKSSDKIDGIMAAIMSIGTSGMVKKAVKSVYDDWDESMED